MLALKIVARVKILNIQQFPQRCYSAFVLKGKQTV